MENILIKIKSTIEQLEGDKNNIDMSTVGGLFEKGQAIFIVYYESEISGMQGCKTVLKVTGDTITMTRFGDTTSKIIFDKKRPMSSIYHTPYGDFDMEVKTKKLEHNISVSDLCGFINLEYNMMLENVSSSFNKLSIEIQKASGDA